MARWAKDSSGRLQQAAMELYSERGFERTTVAQIARRAGLTERTFFRHFADKREVLFARTGDLQELLINTVASAPDCSQPLDAVAAGLAAVGAVLQPGRDYSRQRQAIIDANAELRERELIKLAGWASAVAEALRDRDVPETTATLAAETGIAVFKVAFNNWVGAPEPEEDLPELLRQTFDHLTAAWKRG